MSYKEEDLPVTHYCIDISACENKDTHNYFVLVGNEEDETEHMPYDDGNYTPRNELRRV